MTTPQKPWENSAGIGGTLGTPGLTMASRHVLNSSAPQLASQPMGSVRTTALPPLPPRPPQLSMSSPTRSPYGMTPSMYGGGGYSGYSGYGGYSSYGGYPGGSMYYPGGGYGGYGSYGQSGSVFENRFLQAAEENSRGAFQSVESLVRAFSSVSMMLESTYHAMYSSFRAVLGVVDNFSRLRLMFTQFLSAITILKMIKNFYRRLLYWLGVIKLNPEVSNQIWETAVTGVSETNQHSSWPLFTFIGLLFGGPYLVSKIFSSSTVEPKKWDPKIGTYYRAGFPYEAVSESELSFTENELLNVAPAEMQLQNGGGWLLAANRQGSVGYVPVTRLAGPHRQQPVNPSYSNPTSVNSTYVNPTNANPTYVNPTNVNPTYVNPTNVNPITSDNIAPEPFIG